MNSLYADAEAEDKRRDKAQANINKLTGKAESLVTQANKLAASKEKILTRKFLNKLI